MPPYKDADARILLPLLRALRGWDQRTLADAARLAQPSISRFESGDPISPDVLARIVAAVGLELSWVEHRLLPVLRTARERAASTAAGRPRDDRGPRATQDLAPLDHAALETAIREAMDLVLAGVDAAADAAEAATLEPGPPSPADREDAARAWDRIATCTAAERRWLVEQGPELQTWAFAERLCEESAREAPKGAVAALDLAQLAVEVAQLVPGGERWRLRLQGYARAFLGNARRVAGDLVAAAAEFTAAWNLWRSGADVGDIGLEEWRLLDLEASLRRDTRQFQPAFDLLDRAAAIAPPGATARILLNRAYTLELSGDATAAIAALHDAAPHIAADDDPRLTWVLEFNLGVSRCHLGHYAEVEAQLPRLRQQALELGNAHDQMQVVWLTGRVAAGRGRQAEACAAFEEVKKQSEDEGQAFGAAIVSLELALIYLDQGRTAEVRHLAASMVWILTSRRVDREALAALRLFCDAAKRDAATLDQARRALDLLQHRAQPALSIAT